MMKTKIKLNEVKQKIAVKARKIGKNTEEFVSDHAEGIFYGILMGGLAITYGQSIKYMHLLNKAAKNGDFIINSSINLGRLLSPL